MKQKIRSLIRNDSPWLMMFYKFKAYLAVWLNGYPSRKIKVIGVTGTDGKTTTVNLIARMLEEAGYKVGFTSTVKYKLGDLEWVNKDKMTTQSPFFVQKMLRKMVKLKLDYAIVEVTSHSVVQSRILGINFDVGVWTNLSEDHIEYHKTFENYMEAKGRFLGSLFGMRRKKGIRKSLILNQDDPYFDYFNEFKGDLKFAYGLNKGSIQATNLILRPSGAEFLVKVPNGSQQFKTNLIGEFNVYNCLAAISVGLACGLPLPKIAKVFETILPVDGRLEVVDAGQDFSVVVDYAHTADALEKVLLIFKGLVKGRIILVFGATGGGRDKGKRPKMGKIADRLADVIVLTDDDPYTENRVKILEDIAQGIDRVEGVEGNLFKIVNRAVAVQFALKLAEKDDLVLITGKGGEEVIAIDNELLPYDDRKVARECLNEIMFNDLNIVDAA